MRHSFVFILFLSACSPIRPASSPTSRPTVSPDPAAWDRLARSLAGSWSAPSSSGTPFVVTYKVVSNGSALVEDWAVGTPHETETVFHPDGATIMLTHYCAQGNQPRLRSTEAAADSFVFRFVDVTNRAPDQAMLIERTIRVTEKAFEDVEVYRQPDGKDESSTFHFARVAPADAGPRAKQP